MFSASSTASSCVSTPSLDSARTIPAVPVSKSHCADGPSHNCRASPGNMGAVFSTRFLAANIPEMILCLYCSHSCCKDCGRTELVQFAPRPSLGLVTDEDSSARTCSMRFSTSSENVSDMKSMRFCSSPGDRTESNEGANIYNSTWNREYASLSRLLHLLSGMNPGVPSTSLDSHMIGRAPSKSMRRTVRSLSIIMFLG